MTTYPETETVARILARGYNQHVQDHGPDSSAAGEAVETADGHGLLVVRDGAEYAVRVTRAQAVTADEGDVLDFIDRTVAQITGAEIDGHLRKVLDQAGYSREQATDRWGSLRSHLTQDAATDQELGDDYAEMGTDEAMDTAHQHWGRAKVLREVLAWMDREDGS